MLPRVDVAGKIQQLYMQKRPVPYLTFMHVLNELLADTSKVVPKKPAEELKERFRAACMAANVGILDPEGREADRIREFRQKVYPVWQAALPAGEMAKYDDILRGGLRERRELQDYEKQAAAKEAADKSRGLLAKLGLAEAEPERPAAAPAAAMAPPTQAGRHYDTVDELCRAIGAGELKLRYAPRGQEGELARYKLDGYEVAVKLAQADDQYYAVLTVGVGRASVPKARERIDGAAAGLGYLRMADYAYMRQEGDLVCTLSVGPNAVNVACKAVQAGTENDVVRRIERMHRDLGELVERLR